LIIKISPQKIINIKLSNIYQKIIKFLLLKKIKK
jgi:hypothetical protein